MKDNPFPRTDESVGVPDLIADSFLTLGSDAGVTLLLKSAEGGLILDPMDARLLGLSLLRCAEDAARAIRRAAS